MYFPPGVADAAYGPSCSWPSPRRPCRAKHRECSSGSGRRRRGTQGGFGFANQPLARLLKQRGREAMRQLRLLLEERNVIDELATLLAEITVTAEVLRVPVGMFGR